MRVGIGYDCHRLRSGRKLVLGGVLIKHPKGLLGYSDADVLIHAVIDAVIGAIGAGGIGDYFPDTDPQYKNISSLILLERTKKLVDEKGFVVNNIDSVIICEKPKLAAYIDEMNRNIAKALELQIDQVNVKAKTEEGLGFVGEERGISAYAVCLAHKTVVKEG